MQIMIKIFLCIVLLLVNVLTVLLGETTKAERIFFRGAYILIASITAMLLIKIFSI